MITHKYLTPPRKQTPCLEFTAAIDAFNIDFFKMYTVEDTSSGSWMEMEGEQLDSTATNVQSSTYLYFTHSPTSINARTNRQLFLDNFNTYFPSEEYKIYINDELTDQSIRNMTFNAEDKIKIKRNNGAFPSNIRLNEYAKSIDVPLPYMYWLKPEKNAITMNNPLSTKITYEKLHVFTTFLSNAIYLESVCENLFEDNTHITHLFKCFYNCAQLKFVPENLFMELVNVTEAYYTFYNCSSLTSVPKKLFKHNTNIVSFQGCFGGCNAITSIPEELFKTNTLITDFSSCFYNCSKLTSIPEKLFENNIKVVTFSNIFAKCDSLISIPEDLFINCTKVTNFSHCFYNAISLTSIPENLFKENINVTNFNYCFYDCESITTIPEKLFENNLKLTNVGGCFSNTDISSIPETLFRNNSEITIFGESLKSGYSGSGCFNYCRNLTSIPEHLFDACTKATNFYQCFGGCENITSKVPELWNTHPNATTKTRCFNSCTKAMNYADIPAAWK